MADALVPVKVLILLFVFIWLRGTLPRLRYDQFMRFGWKVLIPVNLVWILLARRRPRRSDRDADRRHEVRWSSAASSLVVVLLVALLWPAARKPAPSCRRSEQIGGAGRTGSFPVPPMDLRGAAEPARPPRDGRAAPAAAGRRRHSTRAGDATERRRLT